MQQEQYFKAVPVSEKMERSNQLFCIDRYGFKSVRSNLYKPLSPNVIHYLEPIKLPDAEKLRVALERAICVIEMETDDDGLVRELREALSAGDGWVRVDSGDFPKSGEHVLCRNTYGRMVENSWEEHTDQNREWFKKNFTHYRPLPHQPNE